MWLLAAPRGACVDSHPQCSDFAALGECESNAASMRTLCARSCDFCRDPAALHDVIAPALAGSEEGPAA